MMVRTVANAVGCPRCACDNASCCMAALAACHWHWVPARDGEAGSSSTCKPGCAQALHTLLFSCVLLAKVPALGPRAVALSALGWG